MVDHRPKECPYCQGAIHMSLESSFLVGKNVGPIWYCGPCKAWAAVFPRTQFKPIGRIANRDLHDAHDRAVRVFRPLWMARFGPPPKKSRKDEAKRSVWYELCDLLGINKTARGYQHRGEMIRSLDMEQTLGFIRLCEQRQQAKAA